MAQAEPIRILQVIGVMNRGGAETMVMNLYRNVDRCRIQFDFVVHTSEEGAYDTEIASLGGKIFHCPRFTPQSYLAYRAWWHSFFQGAGVQYPIVHGHIGSSAAVYLSIAKHYGKKTIAHSHSSSVDHTLKGFSYNVISYPTRYIADFFFSCSHAAGVSRYGKKVTGDPVRYFGLHNAIETTGFDYSEKLRASIRKALGYTQDEIIIGHVGRFSTVKNHTFLLDIFSAALQQESRLRLLLAGDGTLRKEMEEKARILGIAERVLFLGVRSDVNELMQAMDVLLFPSLYEGLPVTLVEAQASGLPCLISDCIPTESKIIDGLVATQSLSDSPERWAKKLLEIASGRENRCGRAAEMKARGYDVHETAKWLEVFYLENAGT